MVKVIALPVENNMLCAHFGHCESFAVFETENCSILKSYHADPPVHQPGTYPAFLMELGVNTVIAGGMGIKAQDLFLRQGIEVIVGIGQDEPAELVNNYLEGSLAGSENLCDH